MSLSLALLTRPFLPNHSVSEEPMKTVSLEEGKYKLHNLEIISEFVMKKRKMSLQRRLTRLYSVLHQGKMYQALTVTKGFGPFVVSEVTEGARVPYETFHSEEPLFCIVKFFKIFKSCFLFYLKILVVKFYRPVSWENSIHNC